MRYAPLLLCAAPLFGPAQEPAPGSAASERAFVEVRAPREAYYVHEPIRITLRFGVEKGFLRDHLIQPFRQELDLPVRVEAPWLHGLAGTLALGEPDPGDGVRASFVLEDGLARAARAPDRLEGERAFTVLEIERGFLPERPGELVIPAPRLHFSFATRFREDLAQGRVPEDRSEAEVVGELLRLAIRPLPEEGRPEGFGGAVGRFTVSAEAEPTELAAGESLKLLLSIEGEGNLALLVPPRLEGIDGFHVLGRIEDVGSRRRAVTYDLAPLGPEVEEIPAIPFAFFDPGQPAGYRTARTEPIPIDVKPAAGGVLPPGDGRELQPGEDDILDLKPVPPGPGSRGRELPSALLAIALLAPWALALGVLLWLRARACRDPARARALAAAAAFRERIDAPGADAADLLADDLAARLACSASAVIAPDLSRRIAARGVPEELAERAAETLDSLVAARFGGGAASEDGGRIARERVEELEASFRAAEGRR